MNAQADGNTRTFQLDVVSDVICPWCYVGKRRLEQALEQLGPEIAIEVRWRAFELNPAMPTDGIDREAYCIRKFGSVEYGERLYANVAENAHADGLSMDYQRIARVPNTRAAHRLIWLAEQHEAQDAVVDGLFAAYFVDGRDIGDPDVLTEVAVSAGLERERVERLLGSHEGDEAVKRDEMEAHRLGIDGVPAFLLNGRYIFSGAQTPENIALAVRQAIDRGA